MNKQTDIFKGKSHTESAAILLQLHGFSAWSVAEKRHLDCREFGDKTSALHWRSIRIIIEEMDKRSQLHPLELH